ncbi:DUF6207 family protein [Streptomyces sp. NPDC001142]
MPPGSAATAPSTATTLRDSMRSSSLLVSWWTRQLMFGDITAADEDALCTVMDGLQQRWATSGIAPARRLPGEPGVRARVYADVRRPGAR